MKSEEQDKYKRLAMRDYLVQGEVEKSWLDNHYDWVRVWDDVQLVQ